MQYIKFSIQNDSEISEILIALLGELPFDSFEETETGINAYIPQTDFTKEVADEVRSLAKEYSFSFETEQMPDINWNEEWERNFEPVIIDDFCAVRATFHEPIKTVQYEILVDPKMSFGTGHHATTAMVLSAMRALDFKDKNVLDFGCGTGVLAFLAILKGAKHTVAVDYDIWCYENATENAALNHLENQVKIVHGTITDLDKTPYHIILANITKNVLLEYFEAIDERLLRGGDLLLSGIMEQDKEDLKATISKEFTNFSFVQEWQEGKWVCLYYTK